MAYWKDTLREIIRTFGRYFSLIIITALGAAAVAGILATSIDMRAIADKTYKARALYDIQIKSTTGFNDDDISALRDISGVGIVMPSLIFDAYMYLGSETRTVRAFALPGELNKIELTSGRLPENAKECVVERAVLRHWGLAPGDSIRLGRDKMDDYHSVLGSEEFTIVGVVVSPFFIIPYDRGNTTIGDGRLNYYIYLHPDAFKLDIHTDIYILMEDSQSMDNLSGAYYDAAKEWSDLVKPTGDRRAQAKVEEYIDAQREIDDGWSEYHDGFAELNVKIADGQQELDAAKTELKDAKAGLEDAKTELEDAAVKLADAQVTLDKEIADALEEIDAGERELEAGRAEIAANRLTLESGQEELDEAMEKLLRSRRALESLAPYGVSPELDAYYDQIFGALELLGEKQAELDRGRAALEAAQRTIREGAAQLSSARETLERERADAQAEIDEGIKDVEDGFREVEDGWVKYYEGLEEWSDGFDTLKREEADALIKLADAGLKLEDAQAKLDDAPVPEWFYFTRKDSQAFDSYYQDTLRLESIGYVFPIVFFVVAVLVSLTTMSRMVDEQRTQIGIYKALGYGTLRIVAKLLVYAFSAGVTGGVLGVLAGSYFFPRVIFGAYLHMYDMPPIETPVPVAIGLTAITVSVGIVIVVTIFTSLRSMRDTPAELMRPKAPPSGKRILIEKIPFVWRRLKFTSKVTSRNIFRYKKRLIMTLAGVVGCTAILLTSFGLRDSLAAISGLQYGKLVSYTSRAYIKELTTERQRADLDKLTPGDRLYIREESLTAEGTAFSVSMIIPESAEELHRFVNFYSRKSGETIPLLSDGILITEKLAREIDVSAGGSFSFTANDGGAYTVRVTGVVENYVMHHVYMPPELYSGLFGTDPLFNSVLINADESSVGALLENSAVRTVVHTSDLLEDISDSTDALEIVAIVLIFLASALAFVVLFNLTNINIIERIRELATIKVLGFYNEELSMYIYRENALVTLMGIALGLVAGIFLHGYVLQAAEIDLLMFPRIVLPWSYVYSVALSIVFAVIVNLVMNFKLAKIDMVESLKSIE